MPDNEQQPSCAIHGMKIEMLEDALKSIGIKIDTLITSVNDMRIENSATLQRLCQAEKDIQRIATLEDEVGKLKSQRAWMLGAASVLGAVLTQFADKLLK